MNTKRTNKTAREACTIGRVLRPTSSERLRRRSDGNDGPVERVRSSRLSVSPCPLALSSGGGGGGVREIFQKTVVVVIAAATAAVASAYGVRCYERGAPPLIFPPPPLPPPFTTYRSFLIPGPLGPMVETTKPVMNVHRQVPEIFHDSSRSKQNNKPPSKSDSRKLSFSDRFKFYRLGDDIVA